MNIDKDEIIKVIKKEMESESYRRDLLKCKKNFYLNNYINGFIDFESIERDMLEQSIKAITRMLIVLKKEKVIEILEIIDEVKGEKGEK